MNDSSSFFTRAAGVLSALSSAGEAIAAITEVKSTAEWALSVHAKGGPDAGDWDRLKGIEDGARANLNAGDAG